MIEKNILVHLYRNGDLKKEDYSYTWYGKLPCEYINIVGSREKRIRVKSWENFLKVWRDLKKRSVSLIIL